MEVMKRIRLRLFKKLLPGYALFFGVLIILAMVYGFMAKSPVGIFFLFISFVALRNEYNYSITYHNDSTKKCIALSIALFAISALPLVVLNMRISLLSSISIAILVTWFLYELGCKKKAESELALLKLDSVKKFDLDNCTEEELVARCKERFKRDVEYKTERAIKHFILKLPHNEIDVNPEQSKKERHRFRKILS